MMLVVGAPNSSNSVRLVEVAQKAGCPEARLVQKADEVDWEALDRAVTSKDGRFVLGISAGASAPELLVQDVIAEAQARFMVTVEEVTVSSEDVIFKLPRALTA